MAANEHKNLSDINRHNPKGFEPATNDTVLSKDGGTSPTLTDGNLVWQDKSLMGVTNYKMQGYTDAGLTNYAYGEDIKDNKSPFVMDVDFGSSSVNLGTITPANFFRIGQACVVNQISSVTSINGWLTCDSANTVTVAVCKITPVGGVITAVTPVAIDEIALTGLSSNGKGVRINETTITTPALAVGDIIFIMIKESVAGSEIYLNLNVQTTTF